MQKFPDIIEILLQKKEDLRAEIEREFAERGAQIDELLTLAGYEEPVEEAVEAVDESPEEPTCEQAVTETVGGGNVQTVY